MKRKLIYVAFLAALLVGGCMTPRQKAYSAMRSYASVAELATTARRTGVIKCDKAWAELQKLDRKVHETLMAYVHVLQWGEAGTAEWKAFQAALRALEEAYTKAPKVEPAIEPLPDTGLPMMEMLTWARTKTF